MRYWNAYMSSSTLMEGDVLCLVDRSPQMPEDMFPGFELGDEIFFDANIGSLGTAIVNDISDGVVTFQYDSRQFSMSKNTNNDQKSDFMINMTSEDWTVRQVKK